MHPMNSFIFRDGVLGGDDDWPVHQFPVDGHHALALGLGLRRALHDGQRPLVGEKISFTVSTWPG